MVFLLTGRTYGAMLLEWPISGPLSIATFIDTVIWKLRRSDLLKYYSIQSNTYFYKYLI